MDFNRVDLNAVEYVGAPRMAARQDTNRNTSPADRKPAASSPSIPDRALAALRAGAATAHAARGCSGRDDNCRFARLPGRQNPLHRHASGNGAFQ